MIESISHVLRTHRWKTLTLAVALLVGAFYHSFNLPEAGQQIMVDYVRNDDLDIILLRASGGFFLILAVIGFISQINRDLFPERYSLNSGDWVEHVITKVDEPSGRGESSNSHTSD